MKFNLMEHKGLEIIVFKPEGFKDNNCLGCKHLEDTGFSWICTKTGEKLEGFNSKEDMKKKNFDSFLPKHMGIGVGFNCPLPRVVGKYTNIEEMFEEVELCIHDSSECDRCGICGRELPGRCCLDPSKECDSCMEC